MTLNEIRESNLRELAKFREQDAAIVAGAPEEQPREARCSVASGSVIETLEDGTEVLHDERTPTTRWTISRAVTGKVSVTITQPTGVAHVTAGNLRLLLKMIERERWERPLPKHLSPNAQHEPRRAE